MLFNVRLPDTKMHSAPSTCDMPSVAMNELTLSFTTMKPLMNPTRAHNAMAMSAQSPCGIDVLLANAMVTATEKPMRAPMERSKVAPASGMRKARPSTATTTLPVSTRLMLVCVRKLSWVMPKKIMNAAHR